MATLTPPDSPEHNSGRPRAVTNMSYASTHSHRSVKSKEEKKMDLTEHSRDKRRLEGKANPMKALHEAQPAAVALEDATLENVRELSYRDREGNVIADPDRSNPTRPRMERPLDTIRGFNAAAEGTTSRRSSYQRQPANQGQWDSQSRRSSHYGNYGTPSGPYSPNARGLPGRAPSGYYNRNQYGPNPNQNDMDYHQNQGPPRQHRFQSAPMNMETQMNQGYSHPHVTPLSQHAHQQSYETMNTNISGSGSDEMSKSTNPSSQNSSFDQLHQTGRKPEESQNMYRPNPNQMRSQYPPNAMANGPSYPQQMQHHLPPPPSQHRQQQWDGRRVDEYGMEISDRPLPPPKHKFMSGVREMAPASEDKGEKRQSWLKRTFSKKAL